MAPQTEGDTMTIEYKIWIQVEEIDHEADHYENAGEPIGLDTFATYEEAEARLLVIASALQGPGGDITPDEVARGLAAAHPVKRTAPAATAHALEGMTRAEIEALINATRPAGGWTRDALAELGVSFPPITGWKQRLELGLDPNELVTWEQDANDV
jgi:hypothetical protein